MANRYTKANTIQHIEPIKNDLVAIRSLSISSLYFSFPTQNVAIKYPSINPQNTRYQGMIIDFINSKFAPKRTSPLI